MEKRPNAVEFVGGLIKPLYFIAFSSFYLLLTALSHPLLLVTNLTAFRHKAFGRFWAYVSPKVSDDAPDGFDALFDDCSGTVLDLGPGAGFQLKRFKNAAKKGAIDRAYGVEPVKDMHASLLANAARAGLGGKYHILPTGAQPDELYGALKKADLGTTEVFDTIVCVRALCGIPHPFSTIAMLYRLLKPGGRLIIFEHVVATKGYTWWLQHFYSTLGWTFLLGGCELMRDTAGAMQLAGDWEESSIKSLRRRDPWSAVPSVYGVLVKRKA